MKYPFIGREGDSYVVPGVPAMGHITPKGYWHHGRRAGCVKCGNANPTRAGNDSRREVR